MKRRSVVRALGLFSVSIWVCVMVVVVGLSVQQQRQVARQRLSETRAVLELNTLPVLAHLVWNLNEEQVHGLVSALTFQQGISAVHLRADGLGSIEYQTPEFHSGHQRYDWPLEHLRGDEVLGIGELSVWMPDVRDFADQRGETGYRVALHASATVIGLAFLGLFAHRLLTRPLVRLTRDIKNLSIGHGPPSWWRDQIQSDRHEEMYQIRRALDRTMRELSDTIQEREELLTELNHRVNNNLQLVSSIISLQIESASSSLATKALERSRQYVLGVALLYELMNRNNTRRFVSVRTYVQMLADRMEFDHYARITVNQHTEDLDASTDVAISLGLVITELCSILVGMANPNDPSGAEVDVRIVRIAADRADVMVRDWKSTLSEPGEHTERLAVAASIVKQYESKIRVDGGRAGTMFRFSLPVMVDRLLRPAAHRLGSPHRQRLAK